MSLEFVLNTKKEILALLDEILCLNGRAATFSEQTPLLGAIPELDSMAVLSLITALEERFGLAVADDEIDGSTFATLGSLIHYVDSKHKA
jgi:acyl carrier protein